MVHVELKTNLCHFPPPHPAEPLLTPHLNSLLAMTHDVIWFTASQCFLKGWKWFLYWVFGLTLDSQKTSNMEHLIPMQSRPLRVEKWRFEWRKMNSPQPVAFKTNRHLRLAPLLSREGMGVSSLYKCNYPTDNKDLDIVYNANILNILFGGYVRIQ